MPENNKGGTMSKLFEKVHIRGMELPNRLVMPPMVTDFGNEDGRE